MIKIQSHYRQSFLVFDHPHQQRFYLRLTTFLVSCLLILPVFIKNNSISFNVLLKGMYYRPLFNPSAVFWTLSSWFTFLLKFSSQKWMQMFNWQRSSAKQNGRTSSDVLPSLWQHDTLIPIKLLIHCNPQILCWQATVQLITSLLISSKVKNNGKDSLHQVKL